MVRFPATTAGSGAEAPRHERAPEALLLMRLAIGFACTAGLLAMLLVLAKQPAWWRGYLAATLVSLIAAAGSFPPLVWGFRRGLDRLVVGFFIAAGVRAVVSLGGCLIAVFIGRYPAGPTLLLMVCYYFTVLAIETATVARATWSARV